MPIFTYMKIAFWVILAAIIAGAYLYVTNLQKENEMLKADNLTLEMALRDSEAAIKALQDSIKEQADIQRNVYTELNESRVENGRLRKILSDKDIGFLAEKKPGLVKNIINNGSMDSARCFEILSGSPLTDRERAATKKSETNRACPEIANPNYKEPVK